MEIYILRHGIAEPQQPHASDAKRALTDDGRAKLRLVLSRARAAKAAPALILTSPYLRAVQTAGIAAEVLGYKKQIESTDVLLPSSSPQAIWAEIRSRKAGSILLSGHEPLLSETVSYLLGAERVVVDLKKGALARIDVDNPGDVPEGALQWLLTPKLAVEPGR
jgi:phosphohistidine phosphatase